MNQEDADFLENLRSEFIDDTFDLLGKCEQSLMSYETNFEENFYQEYMRTLHSIKGSARAVEFDQVASTIHLIESLGLKSKNEVFVEMSLSSLDGIRQSLELIKSGQPAEANELLKSISNKVK